MLLSCDVRGRPIGRVISPVAVPQDHIWDEVQAIIELVPELAPGLLDLEDFSHALSD